MWKPSGAGGRALVDLLSLSDFGTLNDGAAIDAFTAFLFDAHSR